MENEVVTTRSKISIRDIYQNLWKCRNFEVEHIWHRAVFLSAFLLATYAGYGGLFAAIATADRIRFSLPILNGVAFFLAVVGLFFSVLWIMMAKGSKAWYEHYEEGIAAYVEYMKSLNVFDEEVGDVTEFTVHQLPYFNRPKTDSCIFSTVGGTYSVSKINIAIGHFSLIIWAVLLVVHFVVAITFWIPNVSLEALLVLMSNPIAMVLELATCIVAFQMYTRKAIRSSFLKSLSE